ncbi:MAG: hypothetical protein ACKPBU_08690 [Alphaproteobacteria bacterium]
MVDGDQGGSGRGGLRARAARRRAAREEEREARTRESDARRAHGGTPELPIEIDSPAAIEARALTLACPRCLGSQLLVSHDAETVDGERLRVVRLRCPRCGTEQAVWFRIATVSWH